MSQAHGYKSLVMIGDGATDLEVSNQYRRLPFNHQLWSQKRYDKILSIKKTVCNSIFLLYWSKNTPLSNLLSIFGCRLVCRVVRTCSFAMAGFNYENQLQLKLIGWCLISTTWLIHWCNVLLHLHASLVLINNTIPFITWYACSKCLAKISRAWGNWDLIEPLLKTLNYIMLTSRLSF